jgi:hypothetical protein
MPNKFSVLGNIISVTLPIGFACKEERHKADRYKCGNPYGCAVRPNHIGSLCRTYKCGGCLEEPGSAQVTYNSDTLKRSFDR